MCRWVGYFGSAPIRPEELLYEPEHSLIAQSTSSKFYENGVNGDGLGLGWYGSREIPGIYRNATPAWNDRNLREICEQVESKLFLAHIRAATETPVQDTNCHPFRYGRWIFVHNGYIADFKKLHRDLLLAVHPSLFENIDGSTDSEIMFHLALTFGLTDNPLLGLERMAGFVEQVAERHGVANPMQMTIGVSDGEYLYAVRYASGKESNTLFVSESIEDIRKLYPENQRLQHFASDARVVVSEPLLKLPGAWREVPASMALIATAHKSEARPFQARAPS